MEGQSAAWGTLAVANQRESGMVPSVSEKNSTTGRANRPTLGF
jgi:hypothetical protein